MQSLSAADFIRETLLNDFKEECGEHFEKCNRPLKLAILATLSQFQILRGLGHHSMDAMECAIDSVVPAVVWMGHSKIKYSLMNCWGLKDEAIAHLIQILAEAI